MIAGVLREAAASMRAGQEQYSPGYEDEFMLAVADWLEYAADCRDVGNFDPWLVRAVATATAYLRNGS